MASLEKMAVYYHFKDTLDDLCQVYDLFFNECHSPDNKIANILLSRHLNVTSTPNCERDVAPW